VCGYAESGKIFRTPWQPEVQTPSLLNVEFICQKIAAHSELPMVRQHLMTGMFVSSQWASRCISHWINPNPQLLPQTSAIAVFISISGCLGAVFNALTITKPIKLLEGVRIQLEISSSESTYRELKDLISSFWNGRATWELWRTKYWRTNCRKSKAGTWFRRSPMALFCLILICR